VRKGRGLGRKARAYNDEGGESWVERRTTRERSLKGG
jgi:hypothetical protein